MVVLREIAASDTGENNPVHAHGNEPKIIVS
jgi:hypothetical protein